MKHMLRPIRLLNQLLMLLLLMMTACTSESTPEVYAVVSDGEASTWAGTKDGLYHKAGDDGVFRQMPLPSISHHPFPAVYALCSDAQKRRLWIGAWNHLYCYDLVRQRFIVTRDSSIYQTVGLMCDSLGRIRAFTGHGQYRFTLSDSLPGGERTEQLDSICYPKPEYANIDAKGWAFEQKDSNGGLLPWGIGLMVAGIVASLLLILRWRKGGTADRKERKVAAPPQHSEQQIQEYSGLQTPQYGEPRQTLSPSFLERAQKVMDAHLADEDFSIDQLASELAVSRAQLFRKLKAASGQTPKELIDERRMALAATLLTTTDRTVTDIAWTCGFSDASNFRRAFVRVYGQSPSEFRDSDQASDRVNKQVTE